MRRGEEEKEKEEEEEEEKVILIMENSRKVRSGNLEDEKSHTVWKFRGSFSSSMIFINFEDESREGYMERRFKSDKKRKRIKNREIGSTKKIMND